MGYDVFLKNPETGDKLWISHVARPDLFDENRVEVANLMLNGLDYGTEDHAYLGNWIRLIAYRNYEVELVESEH